MDDLDSLVSRWSSSAHPSDRICAKQLKPVADAVNAHLRELQRNELPTNCTHCNGTGAEPPGCPESGPCERCHGWTPHKRLIAAESDHLRARIAALEERLRISESQLADLQAGYDGMVGEFERLGGPALQVSDGVVQAARELVDWDWEHCLVPDEADETVEQVKKCLHALDGALAMFDEQARVPDPRDARIAELEAECSGHKLTIATLESERDEYKRRDREARADLARARSPEAVCEAFEGLMRRAFVHLWSRDREDEDFAGGLEVVLVQAGGERHTHFYGSTTAEAYAKLKEGG